MTITVAAIQAGQGRQPSIIITNEGRRLKCFPDKIAKFGIVVGASYNIETSVYTGQNGYESETIVKAKRVTVGAMSAPPATPAPAPEPYISGTYRSNGASSAPPAGQFRTPEQMFVSEVICAYIAAGKCANPADLKATIAAIRAAYNGNWGGPNGNGTAFIPPSATLMNGNEATPH